MSYNFGASFIRSIYIYTENDVAIPIIDESRTIYYFNESPSLAVALAGTGAIQTVSAFASLGQVDPYGATWTVLPILDPFPLSSIYERTYYEAVNFKLVASGQVQTRIRELQLVRANIAPEKLPTTIQDLKNIYPLISSLLSDAKLEQYLSLATLQFKMDLKGKDIEYSKVFNLEDARLLLAYLAIAMSSEAQNVTGSLSDKHVYTANLYRGHYISGLSLFKPEVDLDNDNIADGVASTQSRWIINQ